MSVPGAAQVWEGLRRVTRHFQNAAYWTERRDACDILHMVARQAILRLRQAAEDPDPDVSHWGRQYTAIVQKDFEASPPELLPHLDSELDKQISDEEGPATPAQLHSTAETPSQSQAAADTLQAAPASIPRGPQTPEDLLEWLRRFAAERMGTFEERPGGVALLMPVEGGRRQRVFIDIREDSADGGPVVLIYSICGEAAEDTYRWALEANARLSRGAFACIDHKGKLTLVLRLRRLLHDINWNSLPLKISYIARKGDWAESHLGQGDRF